MYSNKNRKIILLVLVLHLLGCTQKEPFTAVIWKTFSTPYDTMISVDTIGKTPYNFKRLELILFADSLLKATIKQENLSDTMFEVSKYEIGVSKIAYFKNDNFAMCYLFHPEWSTDHRFIFNRKNGVVGFLPSHSGNKHYLLYRVEESDTAYQLTKELLNFFQKDTILNPPPPPMPKNIPVIQLYDDIELDESY